MTVKVELHTIDQWFAIPAEERSEILKHIRLKDRLHKWLVAKNSKKSLKEPVWIPCSKCNQHDFTPKEERGWVCVEPRYCGIHPSQIAHPCRLKIYNEMIGKPIKSSIDHRTQLIFDVGTAVHRMFQDYGLEGAWGNRYYPEVQISGEYQEICKRLFLEGSADADNILVITEIPGKIYEVGIVHEYKTINDNGYKKLNGPKPEHKRQAMVYAAALNRPIVAYLYLNKNDQNVSDFPVPFDRELWAALESKATSLKEAFDQKIPPEGDIGYHCQDCGYVYDCPDYAKAKEKKW